MRILFATDGSRGAAVAEDFLLSLPLGCGDEVDIVSAPTVSEREAFALLARCRWRFAARNIPTTVLMRPGHAVDVIRAASLERASELVVVGSRGLGTVTGTLVGSVARALSHESIGSLLAVRARREAPRHVLLAIDGSADARVALSVAARLPLPSEARFTLLHVLASTHDVALENPAVHDFPTRVAIRDSYEREGFEVIAHARRDLGDRIADEDIVDRGHAGEQVLQHAIRRAADLIVLGARGQTHGSGLLRVSIADHVLGHAHCAVLVAKPPVAARRIQRSARARLAPAT